MMESTRLLSRLPFATDQRSLLLVVRTLVGLLYERLATSEGPCICTRDGTLGGLHLDAIIAGLQSHGMECDATLSALGCADTDEDLVHEIADTLAMILDIAPARRGPRRPLDGVLAG